MNTEDKVAANFGEIYDACKAVLPPRESTTHDECYFHIMEPVYNWKAGTVFFRRLKGTNDWDYAIAHCSVEDQFSRKIGRSVARRAFFSRTARKWTGVMATDRPTYDTAKAIYLSGRI